MRAALHLVQVAFYLALILSPLSQANEIKEGKPATFIIPLASSEDINHEDYYFRQLLTLVLDATSSEYGPYILKEYSHFLADNRLRRELRRGELDIIWSPEQDAYGCEILPISISLLKELNDYRILLIRGGDQQSYDKIQNLDDLRNLTAGMGAQWPDAEVLRNNKMPLVVAPGYGKLFRMLAENRFDYFARGLFQVSTEVNFYPELKLEIEQSLMLHYRNPYHFFVGYDDTLLAKRLEAGLKQIIADGSFDALFNSIPRHQWALELLAKADRRVLPLKNIDRSAETASSSRGLCGVPMVGGNP